MSLTYGPGDTENLKMRLLEMADNWIEAQGGQIEDVGDYRRMVQCVNELTRTDNDVAQVVRVIMDPPADQYAS